MHEAADLISHVWPNPAFGCQSNDYAVFARRLHAVAAARGFHVAILGETGGEPICLLTRSSRHSTAPRLLVASGFHGEEPAGPWGVLLALETIGDDLLDSVDLAVLPLVNITGFRRGTRLNVRNENPNRGYLALDDGMNASEEGEVLLRNEAHLLSLGRDGVLTCHEDVTVAHGYLYANEDAETPGSLARALCACSERYFPLHPDGLVDGCPVQNGIVFNQRDSSFESWLLERGVARSYCSETPGQAEFAERMSANASMVSVFVSHFDRG